MLCFNFLVFCFFFGGGKRRETVDYLVCLVERDWRQKMDEKWMKMVDDGDDLL